MNRFFVFVSALLLSANASALQPEPGWWWNASQSGRGFSIEVQNGTMFFSGYLYNANGTATWYVAQGAYSNTSSSFTGPLLAFTGGQCLTCAYVAPTQSASPGTLTLSFSGLNSGTLTWPGGTFAITRTVYGTSLDVRRMLGGWALSSVVAGFLDSGDWPIFNATQATSTSTAATGANMAGRAAVAIIDPVVGIGVLIDSSTSYYTFWVYPTGPAGIANLGEGRYWLYLKTGSPSGAGSPAKAFKFSPSPIGAETPPSTAKISPELVEALRSAMAIRLAEQP